MIIKYTEEMQHLSVGGKALVDAQCKGEVWAVQLQQLGRVENREWLAHGER